MVKSKGGINLGADPSDFPSGMFDDFDGGIAMAEFERGDYGTQLHVVIYPREYEYEARGLEYDEDMEYDPEAEGQGYPQQWYGMGTGEYEISEDGFEIEGPQPQKNTRFVRFILATRQHGAKLSGGSVKKLQDMGFHFKTTTEKSRNPSTGASTERDILYPVGKELGHAAIGVRGGKKRGMRIARGEEEEEDTPRGRGRSRGRSRSRDEEEDKGRDEGTNTSTPDIEEAFDLIIKVVGEAEDGMRRRKLGTELMKMQDEAEEDVVTLAAKKSTQDAAVEEGVIKEEDGKLYIVEEA